MKKMPLPFNSNIQNVSRPMDKETFLMNFEGIENVVTEIIDEFLSTLPKMLNQVEDAIRKEDSRKLAEAAHTLKGTISNFYAVPAQQKAFELEQLGKGGEISSATKIYLELKNELNRLTVELKNINPLKKHG